MNVREAAFILIVALSWLTFSISYYLLIHNPGAASVTLNFAAMTFGVSGLVFLSERQLILKIYMLVFSGAISLSSFYVSHDQPEFTPQFLTFLLLHLLILGCAIGFGSATRPRSHSRRRIESGRLVNVLVFALIGIAAFVLVTKGARLTGFLQGVKTDGDLYRVPGLSGLYGVITVFLFCCFSLLGKLNRVLFLASIVIVAVFDVKRGDFVRAVLFLMIYAFMSQNYKSIPLKFYAYSLASGLVLLVVFVATGNLRQQLYSIGFDISFVMNSRVGISWFDWLYGYIGINISVLQEFFYRLQEAPGYFRQVFALLTNADVVLNEPLPSINGFNAGTALSVFAGGEQIAPSADFLMFCILIYVMIALARLSSVRSMETFLALQVLLFAFGNQLVLPYYLVGYFAAAAYVMLPKFSSDPLRPAYANGSGKAKSR